ncbi:coronin-2B-like [Limulus polyphemus]|uniref:Coronin n=1 Tax=Limulus polyphemus TaxID=6850 RepID=A0ABM1TED8_LIMPO|nr:coronin-2B-like [Limulus polyphemus]
MTFRGVRNSKFRHLYGSPSRKEKCYECIRISTNAHDGNLCAVNPKFIAIITESTGGGSFLILPLEKTGRVPHAVGRVTGHQGPVLDLKWNPFNDNVIASCSDDLTVKLWLIPDGGLKEENQEDALVTLRGHKRRAGHLEWHPTAEDILLSAGFDYLILVWNTAEGTLVKSISCHSDYIFSMSFNWDGTLLATTCRDKKLRIINPQKGTVIEETILQQGFKASKVVYLGDTKMLFTTGFSKYCDRQWAIWSEKDMRQPLRIEIIDSSAGILFPYYDHDTKIIYLAGKGDGNIRFYELVGNAPWCYYLNQYLSGWPQRSVGVMPKRGVCITRCEVFRFYRLSAMKGMCEPVSMIVPRKRLEFQEDLYPPTPAPSSSLTAKEWMEGQNRPPVLFSIQDAESVVINKQMSYLPEIRSLNISTSDETDSKEIQCDRPHPYIKENVGKGDQNGVDQMNGLDLSDRLSRTTRKQKNIRNVSTEEHDVCDPQTTVEMRKIIAQQSEEIRRLHQLLRAEERKVQKMEKQLASLIGNGANS